MINPKCCFLHNGHCAILIHTRCTGCKFCKTDLEYISDREHAMRILERKGLESFRDGEIVTTREREEVI